MSRSSSPPDTTSSRTTRQAAAQVDDPADDPFSDPVAEPAARTAAVLAVSFPQAAFDVDSGSGQLGDSAVVVRWQDGPTESQVQQAVRAAGHLSVSARRSFGAVGYCTCVLQLTARGVLDAAGQPVTPGWPNLMVRAFAGLDVDALAGRDRSRAELLAALAGCGPHTPMGAVADAVLGFLADNTVALLDALLD